MADPSTYRPAPGTIPTDPGVYRFTDPQGIVIYVGKAKNLRQRLNNYFADIASLHPRTQRMVQTAAKVEWTVVQNEVESLQLENTWIKLYDPRFNVRLRDDKSYPWLCVTWNEEYPRVFIGRGALKKGNRYFGPYGAAWAIRDTVDLLLRVFPMRSCTQGVFRNAKAAGRPCLLGHIGKCVAPCVDAVSEIQHRQIADDFCAFMRGESAAYLRKVEQQMRDAAACQDYERAAKYRDDLMALRKATERQAIVLTDGTDADILAIAEDPLEIAVQIFHIRDGRVCGERGWVADRTDDAGVPEFIETCLMKLYENVEARAIPTLILVPELPPSTALVELLSEQRGAQVEIRVPQRGDKRILLDTVAKNAAEALQQHRTKRASDLSTRARAMEEIQEALGLSTAPLRIECYDISHTMGQEVVGSMVVFEDGMARKSEYRRFIIRSFSGSNDFAAMHEVLTRRFTRMLEDQAAMKDEVTLVDPLTGVPRRFAYQPALVVVDGGAPQVAAAQQVLDELGLTDIALCGLAKRLEEVWLPGEDWPIILPRTSEGLYLLQRLRDESHRFAITHHRSRRGKAMIDSVLDAIPGLGESRRKALITHFGSVKKLRQATVEDITVLPGFGPVLAEAIVSALNAEPQREQLNAATGELTES